MKTKIIKNKFNLFGYLLFLSFFLFTFCQERNEVAIVSEDAVAEDVITKGSEVISLMKQAVESDSDDDDSQCVEYQYPFAFFVIFPDSQSIETIVISNDEELFNFFDTLTEKDQIRIDFPLTLIGVNGEETIVNDLTELEEILQVVIDDCRDDDEIEYEYCDENNKKVYICHNGITICVSVNAIAAHLDHGDELGQCDDD